MSQELVSRWWLKEEWGFSGPPPADANTELGKAILICANGDGELSDAEREWIIGFIAACNVDAERLEVLRNYSADEDLSALASATPLVDQVGRRASVYFAIRAARSDGELAEGEIAAIRKMAGLLGVAEELVQQLIALTDAEEALRKVRRSLVLPEGAPF